MSHSTSSPVGRFDAIQVRKIRTTPSVNGKLRKLCAYLPACDQAVNASGLISGSSSFRPNVMFKPVMARMTKQVAVIQWMKRSKALNRTIVRPDRPASSRTMPRIR